MNIWYINSFHIQILAAELALCRGCARRDSFWFRLIPAAAVYLVLPRVIPGGYFAPFFTADWFTFGFIAFLVLSGLVLALCFDLRWNQVLFYCCIAHTVQHAVHALSQVFGLLTHAADMAQNLFQLAVMLSALVLLVLVRRSHFLDEAEMENGQLLTFAVFSTLVVYVLSYWTTMKEASTVGVNLFDLFCCVELLIILLDIFQLRRAQKERLMMLHILRQERAQHELAKANIEVINRKCHDLKHQVAALRRLDDQQEKEAALGELEQSVLIYDRFARTGCEDLDVVLTEKSLMCEQQSIQLQCIADGEKLSFMEAADIYSLFGNALDNAIEGVGKVSEPNRRIITLNIAPRGGCLIVHMENICPVEPSFEDGLPSTTKGDRDLHGYGMRSMRYIAEKYDGTLSARWEDGMFILDVLFLLEDREAG